MNNITLGRYVPNNTILHRLDPRTKLFGLIVILVAIFLKIDWIQYGFLLLLTLSLLLISKTSIKSIFSSLRHMWFMMIFLLIINSISMKTGDVLFHIGTFKVYVIALETTLKVFLRLFMMISFSTILTTTTKPLELTYAIEWYFTPLKVIKFPAHEIAMTISIALRFIPTLLEETEKIIKAQSSRGVDLKNGSFKDKVNGVIALIIPLFISCFQRSEELANSMEARGYNPEGKRTRYRLLRFKGIDLFATLSCGVILAAVIVSIKYL